MRKWFYAGAVVGGFLLLGAAPAQADVIPAPAGGLLSSVGDGEGLGLDPAGGLNLESPLGGTSQLMTVKPGQNSADLRGPAPSVSDALPRGDALTRETEQPANRAPARDAVPADLPVGGLGGGGGGKAGLSGLIPGNLLGGGLLGGGLLPDGRTASAEPPRESALFDGGLPLLGGLGGLLPANEVPDTSPADGDDVSGMPAGGSDVDPATVDPAMDEPVDDPRLHEEPIDDEAGGKKRAFSGGGRPVAGEDRDYD
jgi:hypothetical protein